MNPNLSRTGGGVICYPWFIDIPEIYGAEPMSHLYTYQTFWGKGLPSIFTHTKNFLEPPKYQQLN